MTKVEFNEMAKDEVEVIVNGETAGKLVHDYERDDVDHKNLVWVFWATDTQEGVTYDMTLQEAEDYITDEFTAYED